MIRQNVLKQFRHMLVYYTGLFLLTLLTFIIFNELPLIRAVFHSTTLLTRTADPFLNTLAAKYNWEAVFVIVTGHVAAYSHLFFILKMLASIPQSNGVWEGPSADIIKLGTIKPILIIAAIEVAIILIGIYLFYQPPALNGHGLINASILISSSFIQSGVSPILPHQFQLFLDKQYLFLIWLSFSSILGGMGIFVVWDLFSPVVLRRRLLNPQLDWKKNTYRYFGYVMVLSCTTLIVFFSYFGKWDGNSFEKLVLGIMVSSSAVTSGFDFAYNTLMGNAPFYLYLLMLISSPAISFTGGIKIPSELTNIRLGLAYTIGTIMVLLCLCLCCKLLLHFNFSDCFALGISAWGNVGWGIEKVDDKANPILFCILMWAGKLSFPLLLTIVARHIRKTA